ncbi:MAG: hypothetical protein M1816_001214 [Peltula sp. TS41687]|nr:MAG: hypothetical protein M1816_001214 [Peltula sp. TS41687]
MQQLEKGWIRRFNLPLTPTSQQKLFLLLDWQDLKSTSGWGLAEFQQEQFAARRTATSPGLPLSAGEAEKVEKIEKKIANLEAELETEQQKKQRGQQANDRSDFSLSVGIKAGINAIRSNAALRAQWGAQRAKDSLLRLSKAMSDVGGSGAWYQPYGTHLLLNSPLPDGQCRQVFRHIIEYFSNISRLSLAE